jgi:hypothetical protein
VTSEPASLARSDEAWWVLYMKILGGRNALRER